MKFFRKQKFLTGTILAWFLFLNLGLPIAVFAEIINGIDTSKLTPDQLHIVKAQQVLESAVYKSNMALWYSQIQALPEATIEQKQLKSDQLGGYIATLKSNRAINSEYFSIASQQLNGPDTSLFPKGSVDAAAQDLAGNNPSVLESSGENNDFTLGPDGEPISASASASGAAGTSGGFGDATQNIIGALGTCSVGAILGRLLASLIGSLINLLLGFLTDTLFRAVVGPIDCIAEPFKLCIVNPNGDNIGSAQSLKTTGYGSPSPTGIPKILLSAPSLDSIMYCIVNEILTYITQATVKWINSGFNGNPVFVQNPQAFVTHLGEREASNFARELSGGVNQAINRGANGLAASVNNGVISLFDPIKNQVLMNTIGNYNSTFAQRIQPTLNMSRGQYDSFLGGQWPSSGGADKFMLVFQPQHNSYGAGLLAQGEMLRIDSNARSFAELNLQLDQGYNSYTKCLYVRPDGTCAPLYAQKITTGNQIKDELQNRSMMKYLRVSLAKDFDSIITALVNQLIKIAVNKIFQVTNKAQSAIGAGGR